MTNSVTVFASATVANVGCAFDIIGFAVTAPGDEVTVTKSTTPGVRITSISGDDGKLPLDPTKNTATVAINGLLEKTQAPFGLEVAIKKCMPLGSGLGSSAASAVAGVVAANELLDRPLPREELLPFCLEAEAIASGAHADNVGPALLGGFVLIRSYDPLDIVKLPVPSELHAAVVHPDIEVKTEDARKILRKDIQLKDAVKQWGNIAGLVAALYTSDYDLIGRSLVDHIVEPVRSLLVPGFANVKASALQAGALGCSLSGSGPSIFALCRGRIQAEKVGQAMQAAFLENKITSTVYVSAVNQDGPQILERS